jgi:RecA-family ATPase
MIQLTGNWATTYLNEKDIETINNAFKEVPMYDKRKGEATRRSVFNFQTVDEMVKEAGEVNWLVDDMLSVGGFSIIAGPPKTGKSTLVRQLVKTICQGGNFLEREVKPGPVLYLTFEEQPAVLKEQFDLTGISGKDPVMIHTGAVFDERAMEDLQDAIYDFSPRLVVLDTLFDISQLEDINSYKAVKDSLSRIRQIARQTDAHIMGVHHTNKLGKFMGSMAIFGAVDTMITFKNFKDQRFISTTGKHGRFMDDREVIYNPANMSYTLGNERERRVDKL